MGLCFTTAVHFFLPAQRTSLHTHPQGSHTRPSDLHPKLLPSHHYIYLAVATLKTRTGNTTSLSYPVTPHDLTTKPNKTKPAW